MARKGRLKTNLFVKPNAQRQSREDLSDAMARKGRLKTNEKNCARCHVQHAIDFVANMPLLSRYSPPWFFNEGKGIKIQAYTIPSAPLFCTPPSFFLCFCTPV